MAMTRLKALSTKELTSATAWSIPEEVRANAPTTKKKVVTVKTAALKRNRLVVFIVFLISRIHPCKG
jgi:hypothetical protein